MYLCIVFCVMTVVSCSDFKNASVTYDPKTEKFLIHDTLVENSVAQGSFKNDIFQTGWAYLEVSTSESFPDPVQAYAAGLVEGHLSSSLIADHYYNMISDYCSVDVGFCERLKSFLKRNMQFISDNLDKRKYDIYWHQVALTLEQLHGLEDGYKNITSQPSIDVELLGLLLLNLAGDLIDLEVVLNRTSPGIIPGSHCSGLIKILPNNSDIYFGHTTWTSYNWMLRILKKYNLNVHLFFSDGAPVIPGRTCTFSSQPATITSVDDFYLLSSGLAVFETTIENYNTSLWDYVNPDKTIMTWQRSVISNRLAENGEQWVSVFSILNSGTYNNQWNILDYKQFTPGKPLPDGLLWTLEQLPGYVRAQDLTSVLRSQNYFPSYNVAYYKDIFYLSGWPEKFAKFGDYYSYDGCPRAKIFKRDHDNVKDFNSMLKLMRYNDFTHDPLSRCECNPPYSASAAIASRRDLNPENGTYPIEGLGHGPIGGIDTKFTSYALFQSLQFVAVGGPTSDSVPPFQWSKSDYDKKLKHRGHPDLWNFKPIIHKWI